MFWRNAWTKAAYMLDYLYNRDILAVLGKRKYLKMQ
ncbi:uncharacterized protein METZ01_LOCUS236185 [marine metagenome]|uniref:Uncharacterized protein n=1 Tax=marine metagenome TaxID=408172 RepID=A0A382HA59_9ZZZZ